MIFESFCSHGLFYCRKIAKKIDLQFDFSLSTCNGAPVEFIELEKFESLNKA